MPTIEGHQDQDYIKLLLIGDSKAGKTGSLISLVKAGYKLRIVDLDNLLGFLRTLVMAECPDKAGNVEYVTIRDRYKMTDAGPVIDGPPKAYVRALKLLDRWAYDDTDLGRPSEWGGECVVVIDSLSRLCDAAYDWALARAIPGKGGTIDGRAVYGDAQDAIEANLAGLTSRTYGTNLIVIGHVQYMDMPNGSKRGYPQGVGQKLSPKIPQYFPNVILYEKDNGGKRVMRTNSTLLVDLATTEPFVAQPSYPLETGLADLFAILKGEKPKQPQPKPQTVPTRMLRKV